MLLGVQRRSQQMVQRSLHSFNNGPAVINELLCACMCVCVGVSAGVKACGAHVQNNNSNEFHFANSGKLSG